MRPALSSPTRKPRTYLRRMGYSRWCSIANCAASPRPFRSTRSPDPKFSAVHRMRPPAERGGPPRIVYFYLAVIVVTWAANWPLMKLALGDAPPLVFVLLRLIGTHRSARPGLARDAGALAAYPGGAARSFLDRPAAGCRLSGVRDHRPLYRGCGPRARSGLHLFAMGHPDRAVARGRAARPLPPDRRRDRFCRARAVYEPGAGRLDERADAFGQCLSAALGDDLGARQLSLSAPHLAHPILDPDLLATRGQRARRRRLRRAADRRRTDPLVAGSHCDPLLQLGRHDRTRLFSVGGRLDCDAGGGGRAGLGADPCRRISDLDRDLRGRRYRRCYRRNRADRRRHHPDAAPLIPPC